MKGLRKMNHRSKTPRFPPINTCKSLFRARPVVISFFKKPNSLILLLFFLPLLLLCNVSAASLLSELNTILADNRLENAEVGIHVENVSNGEVLYSKNGDEAFIPASNQKIITALTALDILGQDYEFETHLFFEGEIHDDVLEGDLIIVGGGDPTFGSPAIGEDPEKQFDRWAKIFTRHGIRKITGNIIVDESMFDAEYVHPYWPANQLLRRYSAPVNAFIFHDNCVRVNVAPGAAVGAPAKVDLYPPISFYRIDNTCRTDSASNLIIVNRRDWRITVSGQARYKTGGWSGLISVPDPAISSGKAFVHVLRSDNIEFSGEVIKRTQKSWDYDNEKRFRRLALRRAPLDKVLEVMLADSQNLYAESLIKTAGAHHRGLGSWQNGAEAVTKALEKRIGSRYDFNVADGSGYSRQNKLSPEMICKLLIQAHETAYPGILKDLMPAPGEGTLKNRLTEESAYADRVNAKTGYIARVGALSGYAEAQSGNFFAFSIILNNFRGGGNGDMQQIQDAIVKAVIEHG